MIGYRIELVEGFNAISMHTPPVYDAPFGCRKANYLARRILGCTRHNWKRASVLPSFAPKFRGLGVLNGALDIDFQCVEAKINIPYGTVYDGDCAVKLRPGDAVDVERFVADNLLLALAACKDSKGDDDD